MQQVELTIATINASINLLIEALLFFHMDYFDIINTFLSRPLNFTVNFNVL